MTRSRRRGAVLALLTVGVPGLLLAGTAYAQAASDTRPVAVAEGTRSGVGAQRAAVLGATVRTQSGLLRGVRSGSTESFLGVPYAAPPIKNRRFRPPVAPARWTGVRVADRQAPACLQFEPTGVREDQATSEDCLYLDLYRPG